MKEIHPSKLFIHSVSVKEVLHSIDDKFNMLSIKRDIQIIFWITH